MISVKCEYNAEKNDEATVEEIYKTESVHTTLDSYKETATYNQAYDHLDEFGESCDPVDFSCVKIEPNTIIQTTITKIEDDGQYENSSVKEYEEVASFLHSDISNCDTQETLHCTETSSDSDVLKFCSVSIEDEYKHEPELNITADTLADDNYSSHDRNICAFRDDAYTGHSFLQTEVTKHIGSDSVPFKKDLGKKRRRRKSKLTEEVFRCDLCEKNFSRRKYLLSHLMIHSGVRSFQCTMCNKAFVKKYDLEKHSRIHTGEKPFQCLVCNKSFSNKCNLATHSRLHTGEKPFQCAFCGKSFYNPSDLARHKPVHTGERPFKCSHCEKSFARKSVLTIHTRSHTKERPFVCPVCNKAFIQKWDLTKHSTRHTGLKRFQCLICKKLFSYKSSLGKHSKLHDVVS